MKSPLISILIATFNSERTLKLVLEAIKRQTLPREQVEILIVDGGSKDKTLKIAREYNCRIINNPMVDPLNAKYLGFMKAKGKYLIGLDHDEVFLNPESLKHRLEVFKDKRVRALHSSGYITPKECSPMNFYINEFGDPFSFFIYNLTKDYRFFIDTIKKNYTVIKENNDYLIIEFDKVKNRAPLMELLAGAGMVDREFVLRNLDGIVPHKELFLPHLHLHLLALTPYIAIMKNDPLNHYSAESIGKYFKKLEWRIRNNIYFTETSGSGGFLKRENYEGKVKDFKKYLFIPYAFSLILPLFDATYLSLTRKNLFYLIHLPLSVITAIWIIYHYLRKNMGYNPLLTSYDGTKVITKKWI
jgi:glycosyltransferase involved in cell wall biosynthesis